MSITAPAVSSGSGKTSQLALAAWTTATAETDTPRSRRVRRLLAELDDITRDREMAARFVERGTWLAELRCEERDVWDHLAETLSARPA